MQLVFAYFNPLVVTNLYLRSAEVGSALEIIRTYGSLYYEGSSGFHVQRRAT